VTTQQADVVYIIHGIALRKNIASVVIQWLCPSPTLFIYYLRQGWYLKGLSTNFMNFWGMGHVTGIILWWWSGTRSGSRNFHGISTATG